MKIVFHLHFYPFIFAQRRSITFGGFPNVIARKANSELAGVLFHTRRKLCLPVLKQAFDLAHYQIPNLLLELNLFEGCKMGIRSIM